MSHGTLLETAEILGCTTGMRFSSKISAPSNVSDAGVNLYMDLLAKVAFIVAIPLNQSIIFIPEVVEA